MAHSKAQAVQPPHVQDIFFAQLCVASFLALRPFLYANFHSVPTVLSGSTPLKVTSPIVGLVAVNVIYLGLIVRIGAMMKGYNPVQAQGYVTITSFKALWPQPDLNVAARKERFFDLPAGFFVYDVSVFSDIVVIPIDAL
jgi:hypothetical protein